MLVVRKLKMHFPVRRGLFRRQVGTVKAVDGIDFQIGPGEVLGMVGESGCGKSTAGRAAIGLLKPTAGTITFEDQPVASTHRDMQMVFQDPYSSLNPRKTVAQALGEALHFHGIPNADERILQTLDQVGLPKSALHRYPHQFSGGQQQRICIGRAIALRPKLIVCDEAVSALDVSIQAQILNLLQELKDELSLSYLFISHDLSVVRHISDNVIVLYLGKVMEQGPTEEVFSNPRHPYTQFLLSSTPKEHPREEKQRIQVSGELPSPINPPKGCPFHTRCPCATEACHEVPPTYTVGPEHTVNCIYENSAKAGSTTPPSGSLEKGV